MALPEDLLALLREPSTCYLSTLMPDGSPQMTQTWVDTDAEHIEALSQEYTGGPYAWYGGRDQVRTVLTIAADTVRALP